LNKQELIACLSNSNYNCIILDEALYNPIEIIILTDVKKKLSAWVAANNCSTIDDNGKKRILNILSFSEVGSKQFFNLWKSHATKISDNVFALSDSDTDIFLLLYVYTYAERNHWLRQNIITILMQKRKLSDETDLITLLTSYLNKYHISLSIHRLVDLPKPLIQQLSLLNKSAYYFTYILLKIKRRFILEILKCISILHKAKSPNVFLQYLQKQGFPREQLSVLSMSNGSTGSVFLKQECADGTYFIKGNELSIYNGLSNEINAQELLRKNNQNPRWYLPMTEADCKKNWVKYPFVEWSTLNTFLDTNICLTREQLKTLGQDLLLFLDELQSHNITHNDLKPNNIMVTTSHSSQIEHFILTDFGCSCKNNMFPWPSHNLWGKYFARNLCGNYRYNETIVDDAASAYLVYINAGGALDDEMAHQIKTRIGTNYLITYEARKKG